MRKGPTLMSSQRKRMRDSEIGRKGVGGKKKKTIKYSKNRISQQLAPQGQKRLKTKRGKKWPDSGEKKISWEIGNETWTNRSQKTLGKERGDVATSRKKWDIQYEERKGVV